MSHDITRRRLATLVARCGAAFCGFLGLLSLWAAWRGETGSLVAALIFLPMVYGFLQLPTWAERLSARIYTSRDRGYSTAGATSADRSIAGPIRTGGAAQHSRFRDPKQRMPLRIAQAALLIAPATLFVAGFGAVGLAYFFGDPYLTRFITSLGPGPVFAVLMPLVSLFGLFLIWLNTYARWHKDSPRELRFVIPVCLGLYMLALPVFVAMRAGQPLPPGFDVMLGWMPSLGWYILGFFVRTDLSAWLVIGYLFGAAALFGRLERRLSW